MNLKNKAMTCINSEIIQKYIDGEATRNEIVRIETHISVCGECALKVDNQQKMAKRVKLAINLLTEDEMKIPSIPITTKISKKRSFKTRRIYYVFIAASILVFIFIIGKKRISENHGVMKIEPGFALDIDANRPVSKQSLVITVIDSNGNVSEYFD